MLIATIPKLAYVTAFIRLGHSGAFEGSLQIILILCALLSMLIGNLSALSQTNTKRLLGYSSVAHMGYLILAIAIGIAFGCARFGRCPVGALDYGSPVCFGLCPASGTPLRGSGRRWQRRKTKIRKTKNQT